MATYKDYYNILGVPKTATQQEIKSAFRKLAAKHHPDKHPGDKKAEEKFKEINEAHTVLSDDEKRQFYDQYGSAEGRSPFGPSGFQGQGGFQGNPEDFAGFSDFFQGLFGSGSFSGGNFSGGSFSGSRSTRFGSDPFANYQQSNRDVEATLEIDLLQAFHGATTTVSLSGRRIDVTIPKGAKDGTKLRLRGQATTGGDLYLTLKLKPHHAFRLEGDDIRVLVNVPDYAAVLGDSVRVPTLDGDVEMNLPKGTQSGRTLRLRGKGWHKRDGSRGDELAEIRIVIPSNPSSEMLELYQKLQEVSKTVTAGD
ncbi:MAG: DnaJ C-terminal domain-containing protein [Trueperaceae bacterium]